MNLRLILLLALVLPQTAALAQWVHRTDVGSPGQRTGHALAYDKDRGVTVFFGGEIGVSGGETYYNDTWEYDGVHWQQITIADRKPDPRSGHAMCYDPINHEILLTGGVNEDDYLGDVWAYHSDGLGRGTWTYRGESAAGYQDDRLAGHILVFNEHRGVAVRIGGYGVLAHASGTVPDVIGKSRSASYYDPSLLTDVLGVNPWDSFYLYLRTFAIRPVTRMAGCYEPFNGTVLYYGGSANNPVGEFNDPTLWAFETGARTYVTNNSTGYVGYYFPHPDVSRASSGFFDGAGTQQSAMVFDLVRDRVVVFGGQNDPAHPGSTFADRTLEFTASPSLYITNFTAYDGPFTVPMADHPPARAGHAMVYDSRRHMTVMVGGASGSTRYDDTWELPSVPAQGPAWVDFDFIGANLGSESFPYSTLALGVKAASMVSHELSIVGPRTTAETITIRNAMTIRAVGGPVTIGRR